MAYRIWRIFAICFGVLMIARAVLFAREMSGDAQWAIYLGLFWAFLCGVYVVSIARDR